MTGTDTDLPEEPSILHVDMDAFFASVEVLLEPGLRGKPVIVGGSGERGVVASCSYEARVHGIHSAMPSMRAKRLCPQAVFVPGRYDTYAEYSRRIHAVFRSFTPLVEGIALDEAFLDVRGSRRLFGTAPEIAETIRVRIREELSLEACVGVASVKLLAKLASKRAKPTVSPAGVAPGPGVFVVPSGAELAFLHPLPVDALWGVGPATRQRLERFGVVTVGDLARVPVEALVSALGRAVGRHLHELSWARDPRPVEPERETKSVGHEETYPRDLHDPDRLHTEVVRMGDAVASRLREAGLAARTVTVKVRYGDFATITRSQTSTEPLDTAADVVAVAAALLDAVDVSPGVRLLGVSTSNLSERAGRQLSFDDAAGGGRSPAADAVDAVRRRFGDRAVGPAATMGADGLRPKRRGDQQWGPDAAPAGPNGA